MNTEIQNKELSINIEFSKDLELIFKQLKRRFEHRDGSFIESVRSIIKQYARLSDEIKIYHDDRFEVYINSEENRLNIKTKPASVLIDNTYMEDLNFLIGLNF